MAAKQALTAEQRKTVAQFVEKQAQQFADADPAEVVQIRNDFLAVLKKPTTAVGFRHDYGVEFVKGFKKFTEGDDSLRATNAFIMARFLATAESVDFLQDSLDPDTQKNIAVRISASAQLPKAVADAPLTGPQFDAIAKRLAATCRKETDWIVAAHEVDAIVHMLREDGLPTAQADAIAGTLADLARGSARSENSSGEQSGVASRAITPWIWDGSLIAAHNMLWALWLLWARPYL